MAPLPLSGCGLLDPLSGRRGKPEPGWDPNITVLLEALAMVATQNSTQTSTLDSSTVFVASMGSPCGFSSFDSPVVSSSQLAAIAIAQPGSSSHVPLPDKQIS